MALADAILDVVEAMETEAADAVGPQAAQMLRSYARQFRTLLKAAEVIQHVKEEQAEAPKPGTPGHKSFLSLESKRQQAAIEEIAAQVVRAESGLCSAEVIHDPDKPSEVMEVVQINGGMPPGASMWMDGRVYTLNDKRQLVYNKAATEKAKAGTNLSPPV